MIAKERFMEILLGEYDYPPDLAERIWKGLSGDILTDDDNVRVENWIRETCDHMAKKLVVVKKLREMKKELDDLSKLN